MRYVFCNNPYCDPMPAASAAEQLDTIRFTHNLLMIPPSEYYMANCRTLHSVEVPGPTAVSGWKRYVSGQIGDSGKEVYGKGGKSHHSIASDLRQHCGYSNMHNLTEVGAHPRRWLELPTTWENQHIHYALPKSGKPDAAPLFGSDFVVIVIDAHNGLHMGNSYTGPGNRL